MKVNPLTTNEMKIDHLHSSMNQSDAFNGLIVDIMQMRLTFFSITAQLFELNN